MRTMILAVLLLGILGVGGELLFLSHTAGFFQLAPLVLLVMSLLVLGWHALDRTPASLRAFQITMLLVLASGIAGTALHYQSNEAFELEGNPEAKGLELFSRIMAGPAPSLAPGAMIQLGLLGLIYSFRHPVFERSERQSYKESQ